MSNNTGKFIRHLLLVSGMLFCGAVFAAQTAATYTISIVPQYSPAQLHRDWFPLIERIRRETGIDLDLKTATSIPVFEAEFIRGAPDFAYLNPYHAVMAKQAQGYVPLFRDTSELTGILVVRRDSPYKSVRDLAGKALGFPSPNAFGASLYTRALLAESFGIKFETRYLKTHSNTYRHITQGNIAAGGGIKATFDSEVAEIREQLRVLYETPGVAPHPVVAHPRVPENVRAALTEAFLDLQRDAEGREMLNKIRSSQLVKADYERDYLPLEKLRLEKYVVREFE